MRRRRCGGAPGASATFRPLTPSDVGRAARPSSRRGAATTCSDERERGEGRVLVLLAPRRRHLAELLERGCNVGELRRGGTSVHVDAARRAARRRSRCGRARLRRCAAACATRGSSSSGRGSSSVVADDRGADDRRRRARRAPRARRDRRASSALPMACVERCTKRAAPAAEQLRGVVDEALLRPRARGRGPTSPTSSGPAPTATTIARPVLAKHPSAQLRPAIGSGCHGTLTARVRDRETDVMAEADDGGEAWRGEVVAFLADARPAPHRDRRLVDVADPRRRRPPRRRTSPAAGPGSRPCSTAASPASPGRSSTAGGAARPWQQAVYREEEARYDVSSGFIASTIALAGAALMTHGRADEQKARYLRPLLRADEVWCQLFSEPDAGSDLANLGTRAVADGDEFVVDGQKVWTSGAHHADFGLLLARTDPDAPKHRGITFFLLDMRTRRRRSAPAAPDDGRRALQRGVPPLGAGAARERRRRGRPRLGGRANGARGGVVDDRQLVALRRRRAADARCCASRAGVGSGVAAGVRPACVDTRARARRCCASGCGAEVLRGDRPSVDGSVLKLLWSQAWTARAELGVRLFGADAVRGCRRRRRVLALAAARPVRRLDRRRHRRDPPATTSPNASSASHPNPASTATSPGAPTAPSCGRVAHPSDVDRPHAGWSAPCAGRRVSGRGRATRRGGGPRRRWWWSRRGRCGRRSRRAASAAGRGSTR